MLPFLLFVMPGVLPKPTSFEHSVVLLENTSQRANYQTPWNPGRTSRSSGSGFVIEGGRIVTNAHVVADSRNLVFHLHGDATPHQARIVAIGHDCDLALVEPVEPHLLDGITPLKVGEMPAIGDSVTTLGYPVGGRWLSSTQGVVSRIDFIASVHGGMSHLSVQTDAAINPGNSGGPVLKEGEVVGVAYQAIGALENVGYFIPPPIIKHFLEDAQDESYSGFPSLDLFLSNLDSPAARNRAGMKEGETGVRIDFIHPKSPASGVLKAGDILLSLDGEIIANDGTFSIYNQKLQLFAILDRFKPDDTISAQILRNNTRLDIQIPVSQSVYPIRAYEASPRYLIYAGMVFVPLEREYLDALGSGSIEASYEYILKQLENPETPLPGKVLLLKRLDHPVNASLPVSSGALIERVNGQEIHSLEELAAALEGNKDSFHVFEFAYSGLYGVLDRAEADAANPIILQQYAVFKDRNL
jgi:S1-C subfamily serine protease